MARYFILKIKGKTQISERIKGKRWWENKGRHLFNILEYIFLFALKISTFYIS